MLLIHSYTPHMNEFKENECKELRKMNLRDPNMVTWLILASLVLKMLVYADTWLYATHTNTSVNNRQTFFKRLLV